MQFFPLTSFSQLKIFALSLVILCFAACSESVENGLKGNTKSPIPISEVQERLDLPLEAAIEKVKMALEKHSFEISSGVSQNLRFSTTPVKIVDQMCEGQYLNNAPLPCEIRIHGSLLPKAEDVTVVRMIYQERCLGQGHLPSNCKNSNAEKLLFSVLEELKR